MRKFTSFFLLLILSFGSLGQDLLGFTMPADKKKVSFPFEQFNNLIVIPVTINGFITTKFIVDTGAETTILTEKALGDLLGLNYVRKMTIEGTGARDSIEAFVATDVHLQLPEGITGHQMSLLVLKDDYLSLKENLGDEVYGILGYELFQRFVVEINYDDLVLTLHDPKSYKPRKKDQRLDLQLDKTKPFVVTKVSHTDFSDSIRLLVDTGASHALLLDVHKTNNLPLPEKTIHASLGQGLAGEIAGVVGRFNSYEIGKYHFEDIIVSFPDDGAYSQAIKRGSRHGTLGGELLSRFHVVFDYAKKNLYLRRGGEYSRKFEFDMSGLTVMASKTSLDTLVVKQVQPESPAAVVDIRPRDLILSVNGKNLYNSKLSDINSALRKKDGYKIRIILSRDGVISERKFFLKKMI